MEGINLDKEAEKIKEKVFTFTPLKIGEIKVRPVWFDSYGAKSSSIFIETPDVSVLCDPGCAGMQPGYPMAERYRALFRKKALETIIEFSKKADIVIITHYHYDHHVKPQEASIIYEDKKILMKNPNVFINNSQWERARLFFSQLSQIYEFNFEEILNEPEKIEIEDPVEKLKSKDLDFGDYTERRKELFKKGKKWFLKLKEKWLKSQWIKEFKKERFEIIFCDGKTFKFGDTEIKFTLPLFHGIEYDRIGWVVAFTLSYKGKKILYSSDLQGPQIEDYADWIIMENPDFLTVDGPPTYLFGYMMNRTNLNRAIKNMKRIIENVKSELIIYDHHLLRDKKWRERVKEVLDYAKGKKNLITSAEWLSIRPLIDLL